MDSRWFKEDRRLPRGEQPKAIEESEKAIRNSTIVLRRLREVLEDSIEATYVNDEDFSSGNYAVRVASNAGKRKAFREILNLVTLDTKEVQTK
jgi:hypothetical protein